MGLNQVMEEQDRLIREALASAPRSLVRFAPEKGKIDCRRTRIIDMIKRKNARVLHVTPGVASELKREEEFEPLHMYISKVEPIKSEIGRILNDENKYTRLVQRAFDTNGGHLEELEEGREGHGGGDQKGVLRK